MAKIGDITLLKKLGDGSFGDVYLATKAGIQGYIAAKLISKEFIKDNGEIAEKCLKGEISILKELNHPNIYKIIQATENSKYYIILTEYINGGSLDDCLEKYKKYFHKPFPEEIIQHLMRQIIDAFKYIHGKDIIHRDIKPENIMVNFNNENDKKNLNLLKSTVKIIDFGIARKGLGQTLIGTCQYMAPYVLKKFKENMTSKHCEIEKYDQKVDIWALGVTCYNMLIGKQIYDFSSLDELIEQVEAGSYSVPTTISREMVSFLNGMLQYDPKRRLSAAKLSQHPFLTKNVSEFTRINTERASKKNLRMNTKNNQTIWGIFKDEKQLLKIGIGDEKNLKTFKKLNTTDYSTGSGNMPSYIPNNPKIVPSHSGQNMNKYNFQRNAPTMGNNSGLSFYGQKMSANNPTHQKPTFNHSNTLNPNIINNIMLNQMTHGIAKQPNFIDNSGLNNPQSQYRPMDNDDSDEQKVCVIM